jgi:hypothetical protein
LGSEESGESVGGGGSREGLEGEVLGLGGDTGFHRGGRDDGNIGQFAVVSGAKWIEANEVEGVGVHVVTSDDGDDRGSEPGLNKGVVVGTHLGETLGVLVDEGSLSNGVGTREMLVDEEGVFVIGLANALGLSGGVVGPVRRNGGVSDGEEENLDGVGETDVVRLVGVLERVEGLDRGSLDLLDEDITGSTSHSLTLVVGDNSVVGPNLDRGKLGEGGSEIGEDGDTRDDNGLVGVKEGDVVPSNQELVVVSDGELDSHVVVRKGGSGEGNTRVTRVEEWEGEVEDLLWEGLAGSDEVISHTDHVEVTNLLSRGSGESSPEIELVVIETSSDEVVESNGGLTDQVVHKIGSPGYIGIDGDITTILLGTVSGDRSDWGEDKAHPGVKKVITSTGDGDGPFLRESRGTRSTGKNDGDLSKPSRFTGLADKVGGSIVTTVHVLFKFIVGSEINETRG